MMKEITHQQCSLNPNRTDWLLQSELLSISRSLYWCVWQELLRLVHVVCELQRDPHRKKQGKQSGRSTFGIP
ncbi:hypothetical protein Hanom_Chr07g00589021 [Helianthus anomalus]